MIGPRVQITDWSDDGFGWSREYPETTDRQLVDWAAVVDPSPIGGWGWVAWTPAGVVPLREWSGAAETLSAAQRAADAALRAAGVLEEDPC